MKIRIAVVIDELGNWRAYGASNVTETAAVGIATGAGMDDAHRRYWVTAELEAPRAETVAGSVAEFALT